MSATAVAARTPTTTTVPARMRCRRKDDAVPGSGRIFIFVTTRSLHTSNDCREQLRSTRQRSSATTPRPGRPTAGRRAPAFSHRTPHSTGMDLTFAWPAFLWALLSLPLLAAIYARLLRRASRYPVIFSTTRALVAAHRASRLRHLPPMLLPISLAPLVVSAAPPVLPLPVPADPSAIMLALDVSGSMRSTDISPSRPQTAKSSA